MLNQDQLSQLPFEDYHILGLQAFRYSCIKLSKLLVEIWLKTDDGLAFKNDINTIGIVRAMANRGMVLPEAWLTATLDENSLTGRIQPVQVGTVEGLQLVWEIPYAAWPVGGITKEELEEWIKICDHWIESRTYRDPFAPFPKPISPYSPFGTL